MDEERTEDVNENEDNREEETKDEIRDEDYVNDDEIEMDRRIEDILDRIEGKLNAVSDTLAMFVDSGAIIRENTVDEITDDDFAEDFVDIGDLDFSID